MAITRIIEKPGQFGGGWALKGGRRFTVKLYVYSDSWLDGPQRVVESLGLNVGDTYRYPLTKPATETNPGLYLQDIQCGEVKLLAGRRQRVEVTVSFGPYDPSQDQQMGPVGPDGVRDPFSAPPAVRAYGEAEEEALTVDRDGEPILNSAGEPFLDPVPTRPRNTLVIEVTRWERRFTYERILDFKDHVNATDWLGWPSGSLLVKDIQPSRQFLDDVGLVAWEVTYRFAYRPDMVVDDGGEDVVIFSGHAAKFLDAGLREKRGGTTQPILRGIAPVTSPVCLKEDGTAAGPDDPPNYKYHHVYPEAEFADLGFPADTFSAGTPDPPPDPPEEP